MLMTAIQAPTRLILVRHAQAVCNVRDTFSGHAGCEGLTAAGWAQCEAVAGRLRALCGSADPVFVSSAMRRATETAAGVAAGLGRAGAPQVRCGLCERHPGPMDGISNHDLRALSSAALPEDVERPEALMLRVRRELRRLSADYRGRTVVAFTHTGVIAASFWALGGVVGRLPFRVRPANGSLTEWATDPAKPGTWSLCRFNDTTDVA
jgi:probable phosphoglycerate mutase